MKILIGRRFHKSYTVQGMRKPLIRHGFFPARSRPDEPSNATKSRSMET
ncbi:winged helix-turn-helix domain-containing protein [Streptomyces sp. ISL-10]|nr:winged helix-turn-helix domain-containing protein [Streptomyces sp. ISL-10]